MILDTIKKFVGFTRDPSEATLAEAIEICRGRLACPFYSFFYTGLVHPALLDQNGNQCALFFSSYRPCAYVYRGQEPTFPCSFFDVPNVARQASAVGIKVYPNEAGLIPNTNEFRHVPFATWWKAFQTVNKKGGDAK